MPTVNQVYELLNQVTKQATTPIATTVADLTGLISLGNELKNSAAKRDDWFQALTDRIGRTVIDTRPYRRNKLGMTYETFDFGCILQKIYTMPITATQNEEWGVENNTDYSPFVVKKTTTLQKLFSGLDTWRFQFTTPSTQLFSAFTSGEAMNAFISSIFEAVSVSQEMYLENMERLVYANFIAEKMLYAASTGAKGIHRIDPLQEYNAKHNNAFSTVSAALESGDFWKYFCTRLAKLIKYMHTIGTTFNTEDYYRHTPDDRVRVTLLTEIAENFPVYLQSDTFHDELVKLPYYQEIPFWQGQGTGFAFEDVSALNMVTSDGKTFTQSGIVGLIADVDALGMMIDKPNAEAIWNPRIRGTHHFHSANVSYFNNLSENAFVITLTAPTPTPPETLTIERRNEPLKGTTTEITDEDSTS